MKKTSKLIAAVALLLAALMLFSACSINYRKVDASDYVSIVEDAYRKIILEVEKMDVTDKDINANILDLLYANKQAVGNDGDASGALAKYDMVTLRTFVYDKNGVLIEHNFAADNKAQSSATKGGITLSAALSLPLGYTFGSGENQAVLNTDPFLLSLEKSLFSNATDIYRLEDAFVNYSNVAGDAVRLSSLPNVAFVNYNYSYGSTSGKESNNLPLHFENWAEKTEQGKNSYEEIIYLGLKKIIETLAADADDSNNLKPDAKGSITINVVPTASAIPSDAATTATGTTIQYDIDFSDTKAGTAYKSGKVTVTLLGAANVGHVGSEKTVAIKVPYSYPGDATGTYKDQAGNEYNKKGQENCTVYVYFDKRDSYTCPEYNKAFIVDTLQFETDKTEEAEVIAAHRASIEKTLQDAADLLAKKKAMSRLWDKALGSVNLLKEPKANMKKHAKEIEEQYKYMYYDQGYGAQTNSSGGLVYPKFEDFFLAMHSVNGKTASSIEALRDLLMEEGKDFATANLLTYHLADLLGVRYTKEELQAKLKEEGAKWAEQQMAEIKKTYTPAEDATVEQRENLKNQLLYTYGVTSVDDIVLTWEDYAEIGGEENLFGSYQLDRVMEELYTINYNGGEGTVTYKTVAFDKTDANILAILAAN